MTSTATTLVSLVDASEKDGRVQHVNDSGDDLVLDAFREVCYYISSRYFSLN